MPLAEDSACEAVTQGTTNRASRQKDLTGWLERRGETFRIPIEPARPATAVLLATRKRLRLERRCRSSHTVRARRWYPLSCDRQAWSVVYPIRPNPNLHPHRC